MDRLFFLVLGACGLAVVVGGSRTSPAPASAVSSKVTAENSAIATGAVYRPGEPSLVLGDAATLTRGADGHFTTHVDVNGQPVAMLVDTGASTVALTVADAQRLGLPVDPSSFTVVGSGASGPTLGQVVTLDDVAVGGRHVAGVEAVVLQGLDRSLLGQAYLRRLDTVEINGDTMTLR